MKNIFLSSIKICGIAKEFETKKGLLLVEGNTIVEKAVPKGIAMKGAQRGKLVELKMTVGKGVKIKEPLFFCFGLSQAKAEQFVEPKIILEEGAEINLISHCSFPVAKANRHEMNGLFEIKKGAKLNYLEYHYHGEHSGTSVFPLLKVQVAEGGVFQSEFNLVKGTVGNTEISLEVELADGASSEIQTKVLGKSAKDIVSITDKVFLLGKDSRSLIKMRSAAKNGGKVFMQGETHAKGAGALGHIDCQEVVIGQGSTAKAVPIVMVENETARVTHEASVGKINQKELETLMTRGLSEEEATELIVQAMMR